MCGYLKTCSTKKNLKIEQKDGYRGGQDKIHFA
jgi:hypothetical protein